jgi:CBS domain-containing protein
MEISDPISAVLENKSKDLWTTRADATVYDAIAVMAEKNIGALPVMEDQALVGVVSERDYTRQVILRAKASRTTLVRDIMSFHPVCVTPADTVEHAMRLMTEKKVRHLPVVHEGSLVGVISIGDLVRWTISAQGALIHHLENYISSSYPV